MDLCVKSVRPPTPVILADAGIHNPFAQEVRASENMDSRLRGNDDNGQTDDTPKFSMTAGK
ncbi:hypothetical protein CMV14_08695 [Rhizorhabdus dicambivorans]|nr:hypothetical protein CMV14_08695 [Rhizorhabdus dicambivorans]